MSRRGTSIRVLGTIYAILVLAAIQLEAYAGAASILILSIMFGFAALIDAVEAK